MELKLYDEDLQEKYKNINARDTKFNYFSLQAQKAIRIIGRGLYIGPCGDTHNAIYPPTHK